MTLKTASYHGHNPCTICLPHLFPHDFDLWSLSPSHHCLSHSYMTRPLLPQRFHLPYAFWWKYSSPHGHTVGFLPLHVCVLTSHQHTELFCGHSLCRHSISLYPALLPPLHDELESHIHFHLSTYLFYFPFWKSISWAQRLHYLIHCCIPSA